MKKIDILKKAETLSHNQRWKYMIELGKKSTKDKNLAETLIKLACSDIHYEKLLALMSAHGSFDRDIILTLLEDSYTIGMYPAIKLATKHLDTDTLIGIVPKLSKSKRMKVIMELLKASRIDVIECIYLKSSISEQQEILFFTSESFSKEHLNQDRIEALTIKQWRQLAKHFPVIAFELIEEILKKNSKLSWAIEGAVYEILYQFYKTEPAMGLALLKKTPFDKLLFERYSLLFPEEIAELILNHPTHLSVYLPVATLRKLKTETLCKLAEKHSVINLKNDFSRLTHTQRTAIHKPIGESFRDDKGILPLDYIKVLPKSVREEEALKAFNLKLLESKPFERLPYLAVLPFYQGLTLATPFLNQPEGELRGSAISALVESGRYYSSELDKILDFCIKREKEQDPVRMPMMESLADLPPTRWLPVHLPKIKLIITAALQARDCSYSTMVKASDLLLKMLPYNTDFVVAELPVLVERMGELNSNAYESCISNADMLKLDSCLLPVIKTWIARDYVSATISMIQMFGGRIKSVYKLQKIKGKSLGLIQILINLAQDKRGYIARLALSTLDRLELKEEVAKLIPVLIKKDSSWINVNYVSEYLHRYRQDLLTPFLKLRVYKNRFSSGNTAIVPNFYNGFIRWTANQQQIYADSLETILNSDKRSAMELYYCVNRLSAMPSADLSPLINLSQLNTKDIALRDKALEALGRVDAGRGIPTLLEALEDNRANVAIYALRRSILEMSAKDAIALLSKAPRTKVTVLKEIIRLVGEFDEEASYDFLCSFAKEENLHQDVHIALLRAFWKYLNNKDVWKYFNAVAESGNIALARSTIHIPQDGLTTSAKRELCHQMTLLLMNKNAQIRKETLVRLVHMPLGQADDAMFNATAKMLEDINVDICRLAATSMLVSYVSLNNDKLVEAFSKVKRGKSVKGIVDAFQYSDYVDVLGVKNCAEAFSFAIIKQRCFPSQALRIALRILSPESILAVIESIDNAKLLHPGVVESNLGEWHKLVKTHSKQDITILEIKLSDSQSSGVRRLGLALLMQSSMEYGWDESRCKQLKKYQDDTDLWVSEAAKFIEPPQSLN